MLNDKPKEKEFDRCRCGCWFCGCIMVWGSDFDNEDGEGFYASLSCPKCGATADFYTNKI